MVRIPGIFHGGQLTQPFRRLPTKYRNEGGESLSEITMKIDLLSDAEIYILMNSPFRIRCDEASERGVSIMVKLLERYMEDLTLNPDRGR